MKENELGRTCGTNGGEREFINGMMIKPEEKRSIANAKRRSEYNIKMNLEVIGWANMVWTHVAQNKDE